jgi:hypothetical protein
MNSILSQRVFDVVFLGTAVPVGVELMNLTCSLPHFLNIKGLVDLTESSLAEQTQQLIFLDSDPIRHTGFRVDLAILGMFLFK